MKRLVAAIAVILLLVASIAAGCTNRELAGLSPEAEQAAVDTCTTCHTDKDTLKAVASSAPEAAKSEETTGEG
jgi:cytochrome c553